MSEDFQPKESHRKLASELGVNLEGCFAAFVDYHISKGNRFKNWDRALNTWLRNEVKFACGRNGNGTRKGPNRHIGLDKIDYTKGLGPQNPDGTYRF